VGGAPAPCIESSHPNCYRGSNRRVKISVTQWQGGAPVSPTSRREYIRAVRQRYAQASHTTKSVILTEFCATTGYHRKAAIRILTRSPRPTPTQRRGRPSPYDSRLITVLRPTLRRRDPGNHRPSSHATFFHPDCTVGPGISPDPARLRRSTGSRAVPPTGNCRPLPPAHPAPKVRSDYSVRH
jgi:hypothetical protein